MMSTLWTVLRRIHHDEKGSVSLETILIIGAIALPVLIFTIKIGWPKIKNMFSQGLEDLEAASDQAQY
jgi:Flp pilus assembly pilin Flp